MFQNFPRIFREISPIPEVFPMTPPSHEEPRLLRVGAHARVAHDANGQAGGQGTHTHREA